MELKVGMRIRTNYNSLSRHNVKGTIIAISEIDLQQPYLIMFDDHLGNSLVDESNEDCWYEDHISFEEACKIKERHQDKFWCMNREDILTKYVANTELARFIYPEGKVTECGEWLEI